MRGRNPLKLGHRCNEIKFDGVRFINLSRNPLKSGHRCNSLAGIPVVSRQFGEVAIPLNRVIVATESANENTSENGRNPLKSGHRCNRKKRSEKMKVTKRRNPLKSGHRCNRKDVFEQYNY